MNYKLGVCLCLFALSTLTACTGLKGGSTSSKLRIQLPKTENKNQKFSAFSSFPTGKNLCYAVNILASDIPTSGDLCSPLFGVVGGFISSKTQSSIEIDVPYGKSRTIEIYLYMAELDETCPTLKANGSSEKNIDNRKVYKIGSVSKIDFTQPEVTVSVDVTYPGAGQSIASTLNMPASCLSLQFVNPFNAHVTGTPLTKQSAAGVLFKTRVRDNSPQTLRSL